MPTGGGSGGASGGGRATKSPGRIGFEIKQSAASKSAVAAALKGKFKYAGEDNAAGFNDAADKVAASAAQMESHLYGAAATKNNWWG